MADLEKLLRDQCEAGAAEPLRPTVALLADYLRLGEWTTRQVGRALLDLDRHSAAVLSRSYLLVMFEGPIRWILSVLTGLEASKSLRELETALNKLPAGGLPNDLLDALHGRTLPQGLSAVYGQVLERLGSPAPDQQERAKRARHEAESMTDIDWRRLRNAIAHFHVIVRPDGTTVYFDERGKELGHLPAEALFGFVGELQKVVARGVYVIAKHFGWTQDENA